MVLGEAWDRLHPAVQQLHLQHGEAELIGHGALDVRHGTNPFCRLMAWALRLPRAGRNVRTRLRVVRTESGEAWERHFRGVPFFTMQEPGEDSTFTEIIGPIALRMKLVVEDGCLLYQPVHASFKMGRLSIPIPRWCYSSSYAREMACPGSDEPSMIVSMSIPFLGLLVQYFGSMQITSKGEGS